MTHSRNDPPGDDSGDEPAASLDSTLAGGLTKGDGPGLSTDDLPADAAEWATKPGRVLCGDIDMRIAANGMWFYLGSPIGRKELVNLFSSVIRCDDAGNFWLVTPAEMARIQVDDAPFTAVELITGGVGEDRQISFRTNVDAIVPLNEEHPLRVETDLETGAPRPYITVKDRLEALVVRSVFCQLVEEGEAVSMDGDDVWGVWSAGCFYPIGPAEHAEQ